MPQYTFNIKSRLVTPAEPDPEWQVHEGRPHLGADEADARERLAKSFEHGNKSLALGADNEPTGMVYETEILDLVREEEFSPREGRCQEAERGAGPPRQAGRRGRAARDGHLRPLRRRGWLE